MSTDRSDVVDSLHDPTATPFHHGDEPGDESLISALATGAVWAMDLLYQRYSGLLYSLAYRMVADRQVAEDLLQEVFLAVWRHACSYVPQSGSVAGWLTSILRHRALDYLRRRRRRGESKVIPWEEWGRDEGTAFPDVWDEAWQRVQGSLVRECLLRLLPEQRAAIELAYFEGLTQVEIAAACQLPLGTVKARMRLGLRHLRRELEKRGLVGM